MGLPRPARRTIAGGRWQDLPVPVQGVSTHAQGLRLFALPHCCTKDGLFIEPQHAGTPCESVKPVNRGGFEGSDPAALFEECVNAVERDYPESVKYMCKVAGLDPDEEGIQ